MKTMILNTPDIHLKTYKLILSLFSENLSEKEYKRWNQDIIILSNVDSVQLSMKKTIQLNLKTGDQK